MLNLELIYVRISWCLFGTDAASPLSAPHAIRMCPAAHVMYDLCVCVCVGSARRKLVCTICNKKCSSSLNLQEHRKVRSSLHKSPLIVHPVHLFIFLTFRSFTLALIFLLCHAIYQSVLSLALSQMAPSALAEIHTLSPLFSTKGIMQIR